MIPQTGNTGNSKFYRNTAFIVWLCLWTAVHTRLLQNSGIPFLQALTDGLVSTASLAACCLFVFRNMRYYLPKKEKYLYVLIVAAVLSGAWSIITRLILKTSFREDEIYLELLGSTALLRYTAAFLMIACATLISLLLYTQKEQQEENERKAAMEQLAKEAELNKLRQQLQPHFLFNSLNSISALTGQQPEKARHMIQQLSDFLRGTLRNETQQWISFEEELTYLQLYLDIEKVRFGYRLQSKVEHDDAALQMKLPSMLLQPLVENAIKFGLYDTTGEVEIVITAANKNNMLEVTVQNSYDETTAMPGKGIGFGLSSVRRRLFLIFGRADLLTIKNEGQLFTATVNIPQIQQADKK